MEGLQHERSLVEKMAGKPFVLLGVNTDHEVSAGKKALAKAHLTMRSWADGSPSGPICKTWRIGVFPTLYVIDAAGIIRAREVPDDLEAMEEAVAPVLREVR